jgi:hypothetical protein
VETRCRADPAALASQLGSIRENGDASSMIEITYRNDSVFIDGDYPRSEDDELHSSSSYGSYAFEMRPPLPSNSVRKLRHLIYRQQYGLTERDLMRFGSQLRLCQSLETLCLPINDENDRYWGNDLELPILKRLMLVFQYPYRTFPALRKLLHGCPSSCDVYVALNKTLNKAYDKDHRDEDGHYDEDDSNEDGSDEGGSDKDASEEDDEDASEHEGRFVSRFPFEEEVAYFQRYRGAVLPKLDGSGFSLKELSCYNYSLNKLNREKAGEDHRLA